MKRTITRPSNLRFRRWSRKAYASFASIGRHVTIGCVSKSIADKSLNKQVCTGTAHECMRGEQFHTDKEGLPHTDMVCSPFACPPLHLQIYDNEHDPKRTERPCPLRRTHHA